MNAEASRYAPPAELQTARARAVIVGGGAAVVALVGAFLDPTEFLRSYHVALIFWVSVAAGCLAIKLLQHVTGGAWGMVIRRVLDAAVRTLPLVVLLFVPIFIGAGEVFVWARPEVVAEDGLLQHKAPYLNLPFFVIRTLLYFGVWFGTFALVERMCRRLAATQDAGLARRIQYTAGAGLILYALTTTFAGIDWLMSLDPHWYSSMYGVYFMGSHGLSGFAFLVPIALLLGRYRPMSEVLQPRHFHDWGKLLFAFLMLWAYFSFSQFLIIWSGNLPEEVGWYLGRTEGVWKYVSLAIVVVQFALPFLLLLSRDIKRHAGRLTTIALLIFGMRWVDVLWQAKPAFADSGITWLDPVAFVAVGGLWLAAFFHFLMRRPLLPVGEPGLDEAIADG